MRRIEPGEWIAFCIPILLVMVWMSGYKAGRKSHIERPPPVVAPTRPTAREGGEYTYRDGILIRSTVPLRWTLDGQTVSPAHGLGTVLCPGERLVVAPDAISGFKAVAVVGDACTMQAEKP